jgi:glutamine amidotransferase
MHNGQIGGFEKIRRCLEASLADDLYDRLEGGTDSELFFLLLFDEGLERDPQGAVERATGRVIAAQRRAGIDPSFKLTAALADGEALHAVRYTTHATAPTLYTSCFKTGGGRCIMSEPFDRDGGEWQAVPPSSFVTLTRQGMAIRPFEPTREDLALAG